MHAKYAFLPSLKSLVLGLSSPHGVDIRNLKDLSRRPGGSVDKAVRCLRVRKLGSIVGEAGIKSAQIQD